MIFVRLHGKRISSEGTVRKGDSQPMRFQGVRVIAFDLDGTLCYYTVSTQEAIAEALRRAGRSIDLVGDLDEAAVRYNELWSEMEQNGSSAVSLRERIWQCLLAEHEAEQLGLARELAETYAQVRVPSVRLYKGARGLLFDLRNSYRLGLLTNGPSDMQWPKIEHLEIQSLFNVVLVSGDVGIHKPNRLIFEQFLSRLGVMAKEVLYVGNSYRMDVVGAQGVGMLSAWIREADADQTGNGAADIQIESITALREALL